MQLRRESMANPRGATLRPGLWQSNALRSVGEAPSHYGPFREATQGDALQAKGGEAEQVPPSQNLWVGNISGRATESMLMEAFGKFGVIYSLRVYSERNFGFVYFKDIEHAKAAKEGLQGVVMCGYPLKIEFARAAKPSNHLWVGGITVTNEEIEAEFLKFGQVEDFKFYHDGSSVIVNYSKLEDAISAVRYLNGKEIGSDPIRVDFLRSQPLKRESAVNPHFHAADARDDRANHQRILTGTSDLVRKYTDTVTRPSEPLGVLAKIQTAHGIEGGRKESVPSKSLWVGYPPSVNIDEQRLHNALILFGEIEQIRSFPSRHYAFVEFRSVDEARCAKDGIQGRLFNDPRIQIRYSNSGTGHTNNPKGNLTFMTPFRGSLPPDTPSRSGSQLSSIERFGPVGTIDSSNPPGTNVHVHPVGQGGFDEHHATEGRTSLSRPEIFHNILDANINSPRPGGWSKPPPPTATGPWPIRPLSSAWDGFDGNAAQRESKKPRIDEAYSNTGASDARTPDEGATRPMPSCFGPQPYKGFPGYVNTGSNNQIIAQSGNPGPHLNGSDQFAVGPVLMAPITSSLQVDGEHCGDVEENICWRGTIAKGGTPVCHARCISVGKSIESKFPEIVNCSARTDLDMLTKHFSEASGFGLVFFVPEQDQDVHPYQEFLHYLGSKHRAGVAKFSDGTTLFLVPPSDFSEHVLKAPHTNHLFGVVLKFLPQSGSAMQLNPAQTLLHDPLQRFVQRQQFQFSHADYTQMPIKEDPTLCATGMPRSLSPPKDMHTGQAAAPERTNQMPGTQSAAISLTPELIATLTSLLPNTFQASGSGGSSAVPNTSTRHDPYNSSSGYDASDNRRHGSSPRSSEPWRQHQQPPLLTPHKPRQEKDSDLHHHQHNNQSSFSLLAAGSLSSSCSTLEHSVQGAAVNQLFQDPNMKGQQVSMLSRTTANGHAQLPLALAQSTDPHSGQLALLHANTNANTNYQQEACLNPMEASENIQSLASPQLKSASLRSPDPVQAGGVSQTVPNMQLGSNEVNPQLASQVQQLQGLGAALLGHGQESSKSETDKNQRYQSTLQFAANLLIQLQQKQQANKNVMGSSQHQQ